jgi:hypothetical protein
VLILFIISLQFLLRVGADERVRASPEGETMTTPGMAARVNRNPGIADLLDTETQLRAADPTRREREIARSITHDEFKQDILSRIPQTGPA